MSRFVAIFFSGPDRCSDTRERPLIISSMAALEKLLEGYISRMLKKLEETREDDSRLSSELEDVKKVKQQQELHFAAREKELSGLHHTEKQRAASLEAQCVERNRSCAEDES